MNSVARRNLQVLKACCQVEILQLSQRPFPDRRRQPLRLPCFVQFFRVPVGKRFYHFLMVNCNVTLVNKIISPLGVFMVPSLGDKRGCPTNLQIMIIWPPLNPRIPMDGNLLSRSDHVRRLTEKFSQAQGFTLIEKLCMEKIALTIGAPKEVEMVFKFLEHAPVFSSFDRDMLFPKKF